MANFYGKLEDEAAFLTAASTLGASMGYVKDQISKVDGADLHHYSGTGFPEGKVEAPVGAIYTDRQATAGAVRWIKTSGTGNTGWQVEYGDTGWRDVTSISDKVESGTIYMAREGSRVTMHFDRVVVKDMSAWVLFMNLRTGFRPPRHDFRMISVSNLTTVSDIYFQLYAGYGIRITDGVDGTSWRFFVEWRTDQPWPSSLPGTPA